MRRINRNRIEVIRSDLKKILVNANFFSTLFDRSQPQRLFSEKEPMYVKVLIRGDTVELL